MARISVLIHRFDRFRVHRWGRLVEERYILGHLLRVLEGRGHRVQLTRNPSAVPKGDLCILHVDSSLVEAPYLEAAARFDLTINGTVSDIRKRAISPALLERGATYDGPVFVKSDLNCQGRPEMRHNSSARRRFRPVPHPDVGELRDYQRYESLDEVPEEVWDDPALVVERYMAEPLDGGYASRNYVFCGPVERCSVHLAPSATAKASDIYRSTPTEVPEALRELRREMGFDYGKFDFFMEGGRPVLIDANKTPGMPNGNPELRAKVEAANALFADGVERMLAGERL